MPNGGIAIVDIREPTHLAQRDRFTLAFRVAGSMFGLAVIVIATATSSWRSRWAIALFALAAYLFVRRGPKEPTGR